MCALLQAHNAFNILGSMSRVEEHIRRDWGEGPEVVLVDSRMIGKVFDLAEWRATYPTARVVAFAVAEIDEATRCTRAGVDGILGPQSAIEDLNNVLTDIGRTGFACSPDIARSLLTSIAQRNTGSTGAVFRLSLREQQIVRLIDAGLSNKQIGRRLGIETSTVKTHVHNLLQKLGAARRTEAVAHVRNLE